MGVRHEQLTVKVMKPNFPGGTAVIRMITGIG